MEKEILCAMALTCIPRLAGHHALEIYKDLGNTALPVFDSDEAELRQLLSPWFSAIIPDVLLAGRQAAIERARKEWEFISKNNIKCLRYGADDYPRRLLSCNDAPLVLYYKGTANLNPTYSLSVVGTRSCTSYGRDFCQLLMHELSLLRPDLLVVSGLAYGIDINSHRQALSSGLTTVAVLAHGLDRIYPSAHRTTAVAMLDNGGLLTEYMSGTRPEKAYFLCRNRIVAGISDGCLVVESAAKGGSLVTARIALDYGRDVLAVPGRIGDRYSEGCNSLISRNTAALVGSGEDIMSAMNWPMASGEKSLRTKPVEPDLFGTLSEEETLLVNLLTGVDGKQINQLVVESNIPVARVSAILFELEMKGVVRLMAGGSYHLVLR